MSDFCESGNEATIFIKYGDLLLFSNPLAPEEKLLLIELFIWIDTCSGFQTL
jgi:hypothetical protein